MKFHVLGLAQNLEESNVGVVILGPYEEISEGDKIKRTGQMDVPVGEGFVNPLGQPIDGSNQCDYDSLPREKSNWRNGS